jgi:hypothetical protein
MQSFVEIILRLTSIGHVQKVVEGLPLPPPTMEDTFPQENPESLQKAVIECLEEELEASTPSLSFIFLLFYFYLAFILNHYK